MSDSVSKLLIERYGVMVFLVVIFVLAIIAILHFGIKFDINMYIASRKERHRKLAQSYCPHLVLSIIFRKFSHTHASHRRNGDVSYASTSLSIDTSR